MESIFHLKGTKSSLSLQAVQGYKLPRKGGAKLLIYWMGASHDGRAWLQQDEAQHSIGLAMQNMMLAAKAMGYDSCLMIGLGIEKVTKLNNLPDNYVVVPMLVIENSF